MMSFTVRRIPSVVAALFLGLGPVSSALAQDVRIETQQQARIRSQNAFDQQEEPLETSDPELGDINLVMRAPRPKMFTVATLQSLNYSSNAFLVADNPATDFFWNGRLGAAFVPYATADFTPRLTFTQDWFRYEDFTELDFDAQTLQMDLKYDLNRDDTWFVNGSYAVARLSTPGISGDFYRYGFLNGSITNLIQLRTAPISIWWSGGVYWRHGDPSDSDRVAAYGSASVTYNLNPTIQLSGFTRPELQHYTHDPEGSRQDFNLTVGAQLNWMPNPYVAVVATASYVGNFSTEGEHQYDLFTPSLILAAQFAF